MPPTTGPAALDAPRPRWRVVVPALPWLLAGGLGLAAMTGGATTLAADVAEADPGSGAVPDGATPVPPVPPTPSVPTTDAAPTTGTGIAPAMVLDPGTALAVRAAARSVLGSAGIATGAAAGRWVLDLAVVSVVPVDATHAVAVVHASVITLGPDGWQGPAAAAAAVGIVRDTADAPPTVGPTWPLTPPTPTARSGATSTPEEDEAVLVEALDVLTADGWALDRIDAAARRGDAVLELTVRGTAPGADAAATHVVWLLLADGVVRSVPVTDAPAAPTTTTSPITNGTPDGAPRTQEQR